MKALRVVVVLVFIVAAFGGGYFYARRTGTPAGSAPAAGAKKILYWQDPMHPWYKSDKPGIAPDCNMALVPVYEDGAATAEPEKKIAYYGDPANAKFRSDKPGMNPETGNDLVPVYEAAPLRVSAEQQQLIGVTYGTVENASADSTIRATGRVMWDETRISRVSTKIEGWVEDVRVDYTGAPVRRGQPLLTVYSPELLATQQEYLLAMKSKGILAGSTVPGVQNHSDALIEASRRRLELFDMAAEQIEQVRVTGKPQRNVTIFSPSSGIVLERKVFAKQRITPEMELYTIVDPSRVWIVADIFEHDAMSVRPGQMATITTSYGTGGTVQARVQQILPGVDPQTRTLKVRLDLPNPGQLLKADMFVNVDFRMAQTARLSVPSSAVLDAGTRKTVFVDKGNGVLEPRQVSTGVSLGDRVEILSGLVAGERIVTSGNFLLDSESQMKSPGGPR